MPVTRTDLKIPSRTQGWNLDTWQYLPDERYPSPHPVIAMAHGFSANKLMGLADYAEAFSSVGYAVLVFDYRRWGGSDGTPRHILNIYEQLDDYRTVIKYARRQEQFDAQRVIVWGSSFSGGHAISLASETELNLAAVVSQCPFTGVLPEITFGLGFIKNLIYSITDYIKLSLGLEPLYMPAAAPAGQLGALVRPGSIEGLGGLAPSDANWPNTVNSSILLHLLRHSPLATAHLIKTPLLVVICDEDDLCPAAGAKLVVEKSATAESLVLEGAGHFDLYAGKPFHDLSLEAEIKFFQRIVPV